MFCRAMFCVFCVMSGHANRLLLFVLTRNRASALCYNHKTADVKCAKHTSVQCSLATSRATVVNTLKLIVNEAIEDSTK